MDEAQDPDDPKGLIREVYRIEGIGPPECRMLLIDWALSLPPGADAQAALGRLLGRYGGEDHPMTAILRAGVEAAPVARRRGGRAGRVG